MRLARYLSVARGDVSSIAGMCKHCNLVKLAITLMLALSGQASPLKSVIFRCVSCVRCRSPCRQSLLLRTQVFTRIMCGALECSTRDAIVYTLDAWQ
jgi:CO dehydrogenase/acetyl-CoA synthase alpha subunit